MRVCKTLLWRKERFRGQLILGFAIAFIAVGMNIGAVAVAVEDGINNGLGFTGLFIRLGIMVILLKAYDIIFFDWILLCNSNFFPRYYPETRAVIGRHMFGYNRVSHVIHTLVYLGGAALIAYSLFFSTSAGSIFLILATSTVLIRRSDYFSS